MKNNCESNDRKFRKGDKGHKGHKGFVKDESVASVVKTDASDLKKLLDDNSRYFGIRWALC